MSILKYKDPKTGEFKRINPYKADLSFVGKDGIVVNKAADSEKIEISGSGLVQQVTTVTQDSRVYGLWRNGTQTIFKLSQNIPEIDNIAQYTIGNNIRTNTPINDLDCTNKKYVDDNYVKKVKFTNLEQALYGYILDTTEEAYADLDSAVLKDSVAVGNNVYPIADKTRALVSRIEGKTTKMVQLLDKSTFPATKTENGITFTNNGDGTITVNGTATGIAAYTSSDFRMVLGHKYLLVGCPSGGSFTNGYTHSIHQTDSNGKKEYWADDGEGRIFTSVGTSGLWVLAVYTNNPTVDNKLFKPNLFDLTAMNREDITSVKQFKAEFPDLYPYENGNIYPAKISGVKFTGKNLFDSNPNNLIFNNGNVEVVGNNIIITGNKENARFTYKAIPLIIGETYTVSVSNYTKENSNALGLGISYDDTADITFGLITETKHTFTFTAKRNQLFIKGYITYDAGDAKITISNLQVETGSQATAYEPYTEPVSVTLPETYDLHGIGDYKDYLKITKNENNELYTLKKVQSVEVNESEKTITPLETPVETVIATNLTYEQVTAIRHNGGLIEVVGNTNKAYAKPTIKNTVVYRLTAANTAEG